MRFGVHIISFQWLFEPEGRSLFGDSGTAGCLTPEGTPPSRE